jgi:hypothetical protein
MEMEECSKVQYVQFLKKREEFGKVIKSYQQHPVLKVALYDEHTEKPRHQHYQQAVEDLNEL